MSKEYVEDYWKGQFKKVLKKKEAPLLEVINKINSSRSTIQYWVNLLVAKNILEERREGREKFIRFKR